MNYLYDVNEKLLFDYSDRIHNGRPDLVVIDEELRQMLVSGMDYLTAVSLQKRRQEAEQHADVSVIVPTACDASDAVLEAFCGDQKVDDLPVASESGVPTVGVTVPRGQMFKFRDAELNEMRTLEYLSEVPDEHLLEYCKKVCNKMIYEAWQNMYDVAEGDSDRTAKTIIALRNELTMRFTPKRRGRKRKNG